jgi:hypothetical protein
MGYIKNAEFYADSKSVENGLIRKFRENVITKKLNEF